MGVICRLCVAHVACVGCVRLAIRTHNSRLKQNHPIALARLWWSCRKTKRRKTNRTRRRTNRVKQGDARERERDRERESDGCAAPISMPWVNNYSVGGGGVASGAHLRLPLPCWTHLGTHTHTRTHTRARTHTHIHTRQYIHTYTYIHTHTHRQTDRQTGTNICTRVHW